MADDTEETPPTETTFAAVAAAKAPAPDDLMVASSLKHDLVEYKPGDTVSRSVFSDAQFNLLRAEGVLKYRHEMAKPEDIVEEHQALLDELARLKALLKEQNVDVDNM